MLQKYANDWECYFPWFSEELAKIVVKKLNQKQLSLLKKEMQYTVNTCLKSTATHILTLKMAERKEYLENLSKWEYPDDEDSSSVVP